MAAVEKGLYDSRVQGVLFIVAFLAAVGILLSDKNLQTDFGTHAPYFIHWYGMLVIAVLSLIAGGVLLLSKNRSLGISGTIGSSLLALFLIADIATYSQVGFKTASQFATYLFGISKYPGSLSYYPGLYDFLLVIFVITAIVGVISLRREKKNKVPSA